jgi:hypothetical protein
MKQSTRIAFILILSLIWSIVTMLAVANKSLLLNTGIEIFMVLVPFISFFGILALYHFEYKAEVAKGMHINDRNL